MYTGIESQRSHHVVLLKLATTKFFSGPPGFGPPSRRKLTLSACGFGILRALGAQAFLSRYVDTG